MSTTKRFYVTLVDECDSCKGTGTMVTHNPINNAQRTIRCPDCQGKGATTGVRRPFSDALKEHSGQIRDLIKGVK